VRGSPVIEGEEKVSGIVPVGRFGSTARTETACTNGGCTHSFARERACAQYRFFARHDERRNVASGIAWDYW